VPATLSVIACASPAQNSMAAAGPPDASRPFSFPPSARTSVMAAESPSVVTRARVPASTRTKPKADPSAIWDAAEVGDEPDDIDDGRPQPEYNIVYKQNVSPEDMFLGIDPLRHSGVSCSDALALRIRLPGCKLADLDLDVRPTYVRLQAPKYKLKAYLPATVDEKRGKATWDKEAETLTVSLPVVPALDSKFTTSVSDELD
jgi:hypothetical protein